MDFLDEKLTQAKNYLYSIIGIKDDYTYDDVYKLLKSFSYTEEIDFSEINSYIPSSLRYDSVYEFTKGFITNDDFKIYALNYGTGFILIVVSSLDGKHVNTYYGDTINDFTLRIYYALEIMCKNLLN